MRAALMTLLLYPGMWGPFQPVMFTFGENHRATSQLTPAQKRKLWNRDSTAHGTGRIQ